MKRIYVFHASALATTLFGRLRRPLQVAGLATCFAACSSVPEDRAGDIDEQTGATEQALGESGCASAAPDKTFVGAIASFQTADTYANPHCFKAAVVSVTNWAEAGSDLSISGTNVPSAAQASQAACEALYMNAYMYLRTGPSTQVLNRRAQGTWESWTPPVAGAGPITRCVAPVVVFGGSTWRKGDYETFSPGETYTIAATYRANGVTQSMTLKTMPMRCGGLGQNCCSDIQFQNGGFPICSAGESCSSGQCVRCGASGEPPCQGPSGIGLSCNDVSMTPATVQAPNGHPASQICIACGGLGAPCCADGPQCAGTVMTCQPRTDGDTPVPYGLLDRDICKPWPTPTFGPVTDSPASVDDWWTNDMDGVTHDDAFWYFTASPSRYESTTLGIPTGETFLSMPSGVYWSVPRRMSVGNAPAGPDNSTRLAIGNVSAFPSASNLPGRYTANPWITQYNHFGDPTTTANPPRLYIPLEATVEGETGKGVAVGVFDISTPGNPVPMYTLQYPSTALRDAFPESSTNNEQVLATSNPWIAYNPADGYFYSSSFNPGYLEKYQISGRSITWLYQVPFVDASLHGTTLSRIQGGKFSSSGKLYLTNDVDGGGVIVVDMDYQAFDSRYGLQKQYAVIRSQIPVLRQSGFGWDDEIEGLDVLDSDGTGMPGITGQLHVVMIQNNSLKNDAFYFKHFTVRDKSSL